MATRSKRASENLSSEPDRVLRPCHWGDSPAERTIWLALGFIEAAHHLCEQLTEDEFSRQYRSSRIVLHLTHHAIELFLKGAIMEATKKGPKVTHDLVALMDEYEALYPAAEFHFTIPFKVTEQRNQELFPEIALPSMAIAETFRYATSTQGACWNEVDSFDPEEFLQQVLTLFCQFNRLFFRLREIHGRPFGPK